MPKPFQRLIEQTLLSCYAQGKDAQHLKKELESNLLDSKEQLILEGMAPAEAEKTVVQNFGDPAVIGKMLQPYHPQTPMKAIVRMMQAIAVLSIVTGLYYFFGVKFADIRVWGLLAIVGGIGATIASKVITRSKAWQHGAVAGFLLLGLGQVLPIVGGLVYVGMWGRSCNGSGISIVCARSSELFVGIGVHILLFIFCFWIIYKILVSRREREVVFH